MTLLERLGAAKESIFRFEYLQDFSMPEEVESLRRFEETGEVDASGMDEWWTFLAGLHARGVETRRVRLVREPRSVYVQHELLVHKESVKHGDDIRMITKDVLTPEIEALGDFWMIDDSAVLRMNYSPAGEYLGFEEVRDVARYVAAREYLEKSAKTL